MDYAEVKDRARRMAHLSAAPMTRKGKIIPDLFVDPETPFTIYRVLPVPVWEEGTQLVGSGKHRKTRTVKRHSSSDGKTYFHYVRKPLVLHLSAFSMRDALAQVDGPHEPRDNVGQLQEGIYSQVLEQAWAGFPYRSRPWRPFEVPKGVKNPEKNVDFVEEKWIETPQDHGYEFDYRIEDW
jgi:hypothetical protein